MQRKQQRQSNQYHHPPKQEMSLPFTLVLCLVIGIVTAEDATSTSPAPASGVTSTSTSTSSESGAVTNVPTTNETPASSSETSTGTTLKVVVLNVPTTPAVKPFFLNSEPPLSNKENDSSPDMKVNMEPPKEMKSNESPVVITPESVGETGATQTTKVEEVAVTMTTDKEQTTGSIPEIKAIVNENMTTAQPRDQRQAVDETTTEMLTKMPDDGSSPTVESATVRIVGTTPNMTAIKILLEESNRNNTVAGTNSIPMSSTTEMSTTMGTTVAETTKKEDKAAEESEKLTVSPLIQMMTNTMTSIGEQKAASETAASSSTSTEGSSSAAPVTSTSSSK